MMDHMEALLYLQPTNQPTNHTPVTQELTETRNSVTTVLPSTAQ